MGRAPPRASTSNRPLSSGETDSSRASIACRIAADRSVGHAARKPRTALRLRPCISGSLARAVAATWARKLPFRKNCASPQPTVHDSADCSINCAMPSSPGVRIFRSMPHFCAPERVLPRCPVHSRAFRGDRAKMLQTTSDGDGEGLMAQLRRRQLPDRANHASPSASSVSS